MAWVTGAGLHGPSARGGRDHGGHSRDYIDRHSWRPVSAGRDGGRVRGVPELRRLAHDDRPLYRGDRRTVFPRRHQLELKEMKERSAHMTTVTLPTLGEKRGIDVLHDPQLNKSTAFTAAERDALGLTGLLPSGIEIEETQVQRVMQTLGAKPTDLERYIYLIGLVDTNETLFYKVVMSDPARFLPILYDPTVAEACLKFGHIFRRPRGLYLSLQHKGRVKDVLRNWPAQDVRVICATSGERILGLGDLGANGMGIPIGKLQLYTACAAVPPEYLLPVHVDFGTNNHELLGDALYLGLRQPRASTAERDEFVEEFVQAIQEVFSGCCLHFEDWAGVDAMRLLARYRDRVCCYNDDIQGTAGVALAGILSALRVTGGKLRDQRVLFLGAGSA